MKYVVNSDRLSAFDYGQTVSVDQLAGCNIEALVAGGHLKPVDDQPQDSDDDSAEVEND